MLKAVRECPVYKLPKSFYYGLYWFKNIGNKSMNKTAGMLCNYDLPYSEELDIFVQYFLMRSGANNRCITVTSFSNLPIKEE